VLTTPLSASTLAKYFSEVNKSIVSIDLGELPEFLTEWNGNEDAVKKLKKELDKKRAAKVKAEAEAKAKAEAEAEAEAKAKAEAKAEAKAKAEAETEAKADDKSEGEKKVPVIDMSNIPECGIIPIDVVDTRKPTSKENEKPNDKPNGHHSDQTGNVWNDDEVIQNWNALREQLNAVIGHLDSTIMPRTTKETMRSFATSISRIGEGVIEMHVKHKEKKAA
jgi:hypothetical protein